MTSKGTMNNNDRKLCESNPKLADLCALWVALPGHFSAPCNCCRLCACPAHDGERHRNLDWCFICIGRDHHKEVRW
jgi:hypothetical protein